MASYTALSACARGWPVVRVEAKNCAMMAHSSGVVSVGQRTSSVGDSVRAASFIVCAPHNTMHGAALHVSSYSRVLKCVLSALEVDIDCDGAISYFFARYLSIKHADNVDPARIVELVVNKLSPKMPDKVINRPVLEKSPHASRSSSHRPRNAECVIA